MRLIIIGDLHLYNDGQRNSIKVIQYLNNLINRLNPDAVVYLGDIFHRANIPIYVISAFTQLLQIKCEHFVLIGNHDRISLSETLLDWMKPIVRHHIHIIDTPCIIDDFYFIPFGYTPQKQLTPGKIIFAHIGIKDLVTFPTKDDYLFIKDILELQPKLWVSGHYHEYNQLSNLPIISLGATIPVGFYTDSEAYILLYDTELNKLQPIVIPGPRFIGDVTLLNKLHRHNWYLIRLKNPSDDLLKRLSSDKRVVLIESKSEIESKQLDLASIEISSDTFLRAIEAYVENTLPTKLLSFKDSIITRIKKELTLSEGGCDEHHQLQNNIV